MRARALRAPRLCGGLRDSAQPRLCGGLGDSAQVESRYPSCAEPEILVHYERTPVRTPCGGCIDLHVRLCLPAF